MTKLQNYWIVGSLCALVLCVALFGQGTATDGGGGGTNPIIPTGGSGGNADYDQLTATNLTVYSTSQFKGAVTISNTLNLVRSGLVWAFDGNRYYMGTNDGGGVFDFEANLTPTPTNPDYVLIGGRRQGAVYLEGNNSVGIIVDRNNNSGGADEFIVRKDATNGVILFRVTEAGNATVSNTLTVAGTSVLRGALTYTNGTDGVGNVLTSDGSGNITLAAAAGGGVSTSDPGYVRTSLNNFKSKNTALTTSYASILPAITAGANARVQKLRVVNATTAAATFNILTSNGPITNLLEDVYTLGPGATYEMSGLVVKAAGVLSAKASGASGLNVQLSYVEETNSLMLGECFSLLTTPVSLVPTVASSTRARVWSLFMHNTNATAMTFNIITLDKTAGTTIALATNFTIGPFSTVKYEDINMETGGSLQGWGSTAGSVEATVSYELRAN